MQIRLASLQNQQVNWDDLRLLIVVAGHPSLLEAGRVLGIATTTVSRRLAALEAGVGAQLVHRTHVGTVLTVVGKALVAALEPFALEMEAALRQSAGADSQIEGAIKVSVAEGLVPLTLEAIQSFRTAHPGVVFELDASHRSLDMGKNEADVAVRMLRPKSDGLVVRRIGPVHFGVYMSSQLPLARSAQRGAGLLARMEGVVLGGELAGLKETVWLSACVRAVALQTETLGSLIDAVRRGIGVGVIPDELVQADSRLRRLCDCEAVPQKTLWLVMHQRTAKLPRIRLFADHMTAHLRAASAGAGAAVTQ
jgi:DNA-binding transcriptional LysR family regulator